jgi:hypothetical protein
MHKIPKHNVGGNNCSTRLVEARRYGVVGSRVARRKGRHNVTCMKWDEAISAHCQL